MMCSSVVFARKVDGRGTMCRLFFFPGVPRNFLRKLSNAKFGGIVNMGDILLRVDMLKMIRYTGGLSQVQKNVHHQSFAAHQSSVRRSSCLIQIPQNVRCIPTFLFPGYGGPPDDFPTHNCFSVQQTLSALEELLGAILFTHYRNDGAHYCINHASHCCPADFVFFFRGISQIENCRCGRLFVCTIFGDLLSDYRDPQSFAA